MEKLKIGTSGEIVADPQNGLFVENRGELAFLSKSAKDVKSWSCGKIAGPAGFAEIGVFVLSGLLAGFRRKRRRPDFGEFSVFWPFWPSCRGMPVFPSWTCRGGLWAWCPF